MALAHQSISTIDAPQFINLSPQDTNPLMSKCQIKVLYLGQNRNGSYFSKEVVMEMAKTLRGAPIVGYYKEDKDDFRDHGKKVIFDDEGIKFECLTKPYGFVSPDAEVWFKDFNEVDQEGNTVTRTYLMTNGYLWTGQFEEIQKVYEDDGKPHSMELDEKSVKGEWSKSINPNVELFIINDAIFSKLCVLGDDVEPCFEGSGVTAPQVSASFTLDQNFKHTLFEMMQELTEVLKGGSQVANVEDKTVDFTVEDKDNLEQPSLDENQVIQTPEASFVEKQSEEEEKEEESKEEEKDEDENKKEYSLLKQSYEELQTKYSALEEEVNELREFKLNIESKQKDDLINEFSMLSEEDKKDVIENKAKYTLDEIKSKLAVICFEKKVNFNSEKASENEIEEKDNVVTYTINDTKDLTTPDWVKEVENTMNNKY